MRQDSLPFGHSPDYSRENFLVSGCNKEALTWIDAWPDWTGGMLYLYGPPGSGKTHLAHIWANHASAVFLNPAQLGMASSDRITQGHAAFVIDGMNGIDETALFHLLNHLRERQDSLLITASLPARQLPLTLPDLASRLQAMSAVALHAPDDALVSALLIKLFQDRQLRVGPDVIEYLLPRVERSFEALHNLVNRLDAEALRQHKNITIPFVRSLMETIWPS